MKPLYCALLLGMATGLVRPAQAQQRFSSEAATAELRLIEDIGLDQVSATLLPTADNFRNSSTLFQQGIGNKATVDQQTLSTTSNQAYVIQAGAANVLGLTQTGGGNSTYLTQEGTKNGTSFEQNGQNNSSVITQRGSDNQLQGLVEGERNQLNVLQDGNGNHVQSQIQLSDRKYNITQNGSGNTLTQLETTPQSPRGYTIEMRGNGMNVIVEQGIGKLVR